jgi:DNA invertase Pin-like site-specific DNA recombinase
MLERAVIYCRVSTKEQAENLSLPTQMKVCRAYCGQQGWEVVREFEERGESAKTTDRPEFQAMLAFCTLKKNRVKFLVCYDVSRFSRNNSDYQWAKALLLKQNINICPVTQCGIDDSPQGRLMETILVGFAQFDNDVKAVRTREGMKEAIGKGIWVWLRIPA